MLPDATSPAGKRGVAPRSSGREYPVVFEGPRVNLKRCCACLLLLVVVGHPGPVRVEAAPTVSPASPGACPIPTTSPAPQGVDRVDEALARDAAEYRSLRSTHDREARRWGGRKHKLMAHLGQLLGDGRHTVEQVRSLMGAPDGEARPGDSTWRMIWHDPAAPRPATTAATRLLIYEWRGRHDFLYFICDGSRVLKSAWWMAYE